ncbi:hypothetical protein [Methanobacterium congolense]|uniref:Uncharacterized protein n=1 Tax=Methanobacterium congolense TaxID=118062 RepID=A0A1D3KZ18_9EURY|nr:hypothetical protein [Methanobacterium congolense]SCG84622.1 putative protein [Methanobacterium congolense]
MDRKVILGIVLGAITFVVVTFLAWEVLLWMGYSVGTKMPGQNFQKAIAVLFGAVGASFAYTLINGHKNPPKPEDKLDVVEMMKDFGKKM